MIFENGEGKLAYWDLKDNTLKYCGTNEIVNDEDEQGFAPQIKPEYMSKYLDVGSVVRGNIDKPKDVKADKGNLTSLSINGDYYNVTDYALQDGQVAVGETETIYDKDGKSNPVEVQTGATFLKVADRNDPTKSDDVKVDGLVTYNTREDNKGNVTTDYGNITLAGYVEKDENGNIKYDEKGHPIRQGTLITNVKDGTIWKDSKDAVNGSQLYAVDQKVNAGWTAKVGETSINVRPNLENETGKDVLNFEAGDNIKLTPNADENKIKIAADGVVSYDKNTSGGYDTTSVTLGEEGNKYVPVSDDGKTPASGGVKLTNVAYASGNDKSEAVNVDYLEKYVDKNGGGSWNITANKNDENATSIGKGNTVDFSGDDNITVAKTDKADKSGADITVNLNDNITLGEGENQIQLNGAPKDDDTPAISVGNNFAVNHDGSITSTVANNAGGGAKADATFNFDEHGLSVKDNVGKTSTLIDGGTITVRNALDNQTVINGKAITAGDIKLNSENNASTMVGLSNTTWENNETWQNEHVVDNRAATEGQLKQAINNLETSTTGNEKHIATAADGEAHPQGGYTVDKEDHTVTLTEVDGNGKATGNNVVISGIASSDEVGDLNYSKVVNEGDDLTINDDDSVTLAIGKLDDRVINNTNNITKLQGQTIDGGYVEDGVINLTHKNDDNTTKTVAQIDGLKDYTLQNGQFITKAKDENGKFTGATELTIADRYDPTKTEKVTIDGLVTYNTTQKLDETTGETIVTGIDYDNIRLAGENGTRITNLVDGWVDEKSTDAVNGSQLASVKDGAVKYWQNEDGSYDKSFVQLEGGEEGTTITHLKDGVVAEYSTEAINGSQLWETQQQIKDVETTANKHTIVSTTDDSNLTVKNVAKEGEADNYQVTLNDEVVLGDYFDKGNSVLISGNSGTISATNSITVGEDQGLVIDGQKKTIQGLSNTTWTGTTETPNRAATEGQLQNAYDGSVKYWRNEDGTYDKSFIQLEGGEEGTTITHLKDGVVAEYSTEAINGSQLWETQQQIKDVETTANKHTIVSTTKDSNLTVKNVAGEGEADNYQVALKDDITLKGDSSSIELTGTKGTIQVNQETAEGTNFTNINGNVVSIGYTNSEGIENAIVIDGGKGTITGLSNTTWDDELATQVANSEELQGTAATQGQLQQAVSAVATEAAKQHTTVSGDDNLTVKSSVNENGGTNYQVTLDDDITLGNPKAGNTEGERSFTINTTDPEGYVPKSYETGSGADFIKENGGFMLFATDTQGYGVFGVTAKGSAWAKDFKTYTTDIYGNNTQYSLNEIGDAVAQMSSYYNKENGKSYTVFSRYLNEAEKDNPFATVDENATRDIPLALRDDGTVLIGATIKGDDFIDNGIRINAEIDDDGNNVATITGLENTTWTPPAPVATFANEGTETSRAATEAQLNDLYSTVVAYASGTDGSEAVNVDYLKDTINKAVEAGGSISNSDKHLVANTAEGSNGVYKPNAEGNVNLIVSDEKGNSSTVTIGDVASKTELDSLKTNVGDLNYDKVTGDKLVNGDSVTTAIGKLDNKIENISGTATDAANNTVTGGTIKDDGTISLTQKDGGTVALDGKLTDSGVVQDGTKFDGETGTITITSQDKYSGKTSSVKVEGIASTEVVGATNKEDLATAYKDADKDGNATTEYITDSESMVEADVALDHAIQDVANTGYANDMVLSNRIDSVEKRLGNVEERIDKVGAMAAAIANLRTMGFDPEAPTEIAIGVGQYKSETGIAIGVFHYPNQDFMLSASLSSSGDELMGGIGATWKLGRKSAAERAKDEEARHLEQAEEMKKLAQQEKVKAQAQRHAKLLAERQQASQKNA